MGGLCKSRRKEAVCMNGHTRAQGEIKTHRRPRFCAPPATRQRKSQRPRETSQSGLGGVQSPLLRERACLCPLQPRGRGRSAQRSRPSGRTRCTRASPSQKRRHQRGSPFLQRGPHQPAQCGQRTSCGRRGRAGSTRTHGQTRGRKERNRHHPLAPAHPRLALAFCGGWLKTGMKSARTLRL